VVHSEATPGVIHGGRETILIVEDESSVREYAVAVMQPLGYRVLQAASGLDALEVWKWHSARIDLVLTDMVMPDNITGRELATRLLTEKPSLAVVFTSGYSHAEALDIFGSDFTTRFVHKPYSPRLLAQTIREALDERGSKMARPPTPS
jgi:CheY-like chemotaxis protein